MQILFEVWLTIKAEPVVNTTPLSIPTVVDMALSNLPLAFNGHVSVGLK
jgi:hypothetical protein